MRHVARWSVRAVRLTVALALLTTTLGPALPPHQPQAAAASAEYSVAWLVDALASFVGRLAPAPAHASLNGDLGFFGNAVPCLNSDDQFATTCTAGTLAPVESYLRRQMLGNPALLNFNKTGQTPLLKQEQIGSTYGLAYDDGQRSGRRQLFIGAFKQRLAAFGPDGPGAIYRYDLSSGQVSTFARLNAAPASLGDPNANIGDSSTLTERNDIFDKLSGPWVTKMSLGDLELHPAGEILYAVNLYSRQIERLNILTGQQLTPININGSIISSDSAVQADLRPFGLEFQPGSRGNWLFVGVVDSAERLSSTTPRAYVIAINTSNPDDQYVAINQDLFSPEIALRHFTAGSWQSIPAWFDWGFQAINWGNPVRRPQPIISDLQFSLDGSELYVGLRDRSGDQFYSDNAPAADKHVVVSQGDTLVYRNLGGNWSMQTQSVSPAYLASDYFNDDYIGDQYPSNHAENHGGAFATTIEKANGAPRFELVVNSITPYQGRTGGVTWYSTYPYERERLTALEMIPQSNPSQGKAQRLGDIEILCNYALIGDKVWKDTNRNGLQDTGEPPISGLVLELYDQAGTRAAQATTRGDGLYRFAVVPGQPYTIRPAVNNPQLNGLVPTMPDAAGKDERDSDLDPASGEVQIPGQMRESVNWSFDLGYMLPLPTPTHVPPTALPTNTPIPPTNVPPPTPTVPAVGRPTSTPEPAPQTALIGDRVWLDSNRNGLQEAGEPGIAGASVELFFAGSWLASTTSDANGGYRFVVPAADIAAYVVRVQAGGPNIALLGSYNHSPQNSGSNAEIDSDLIPHLELSAAIAAPQGTINLSVDAGFAPPAPTPTNTSIPPTPTPATVAAFAELGDTVWNDQNANGIQDAGEPGIAGVSVQLIDTLVGSVIDEVQTSATGSYHFTVLSSATPRYRVRVLQDGANLAVLRGWRQSPRGASAPSSDSDGDEHGESAMVDAPANTTNDTLDFGFYAVATIGDSVWNDLNGDGVQDTGEPGLAGLTVELLRNGALLDTALTSSAGEYEFTAPISDQPIYQIRVQAGGPNATLLAGYHHSPAGAGDERADSDLAGATELTPPFAAPANSENQDIDAGFFWPAATLGDTIWNDENNNGLQDAGEPGIAGAIVELLDSTTGALLQMRSTDAEGHYRFMVPSTALAAYRVRLPHDGSNANLLVGFQPVAQDAGDDTIDSDADAAGLTMAVTAPALSHSNELDIGMYQPHATIGDRVWNDLDTDGTQDSDEPGIAAVTVQLLDATERVIATAVTDAEGLFRFRPLASDTPAYRLRVPLDGPNAAILGGFRISQPSVGDDGTDSDLNPSDGRSRLVAAPAESLSLNLDAGLHRPLAQIGDYVWDDRDGDGVQDMREPGLSGLIVQLLDAQGIVLQATTTDSSGRYGFSLIASDTPAYRVRVPLDGPNAPLLAGFVPSPQDATDDSQDSDAAADGQTALFAALADSQSNALDIGLHRPTARLGDRIWHDANADGAQNQGEQGLAGVTVELLDAAGSVLDETTTNADGRYEFVVVASEAPAYRVHVPLGGPNTQALAGMIVAPQDEPEADDATDSDGDPSGLLPLVAAPQGSVNSTLDLGLYRRTLVPLGDLVWYDSDGDGVQDTGEPGIASVSVELLDAAAARVIDTATTDAGGRYQFLVPVVARRPAYRVRVRLDGPNATVLSSYERSPRDRGGNDAQDSDGDPQGLSPAVAAPMGSVNASLDFGFFGQTNVTVSKSGPTNAQRGELITYTLTVRNTSSQPAEGVVLRDTLPSGVLFAGAQPAPDAISGSADASGGETVEALWRIGRLGPRETRLVSVAALVRDDAVGSLVNRARIATTTYGDLPSDNETTWNTSVVQVRADLSLAKTGPAEAARGTTITYTLVYRNAGPDPAQGVSLDESFPPGFVFERAVPAPFNREGNQAHWQLGTLAAGASGTISVVGRMAEGGVWINSAELHGTNYDPNLDNNRSQSVTTVSGPPLVDLALQKFGPARVEPSGRLFYYLEVRERTGNRPAEQVVLSDTLPAGVTFVSAAGLTQRLDWPVEKRPQRFAVTVSGQQVQIDLGTIPAGYYDQIVIVAQAPATIGTMTNLASISTSHDETTAKNNRSQVVTEVRPRDLTSIGDRVFLDRNGDGDRDNVTQEPGIDEVALDLYRFGADWSGNAACAPTAQAQYVRSASTDGSGAYLFADALAPAAQWGDIVALGAQNFSPNGSLAGLKLSAGFERLNAANAAIHDSNAAVAVVAAPDGTCGAASDPSESAYWQYRRAGLPSGSVLIGGLRDEAGHAQNLFADIGMIERWNVALSKFGPAQALAGEELVYTIVVSNTRGDEQVALVVSDTLPLGMRFVSANPVPNRVSGQQIGWDLRLAPVSERTITVRAVTSATLPGQVLANTACASVSAGEYERNDNCGSTRTTLLPRADLIVDVDAPAQATAGEPLVYTLAYTNTGSDVARASVLTVTLPTGVVYAGASRSPLIGGRTLRFPLGDLASGTSGVITVTTQLEEQVTNGTSLSVLLRGSTASVETSLANNEDRASTLTRNADLWVEITGPAQPTAGARWSYGVRYTNAGPALARGSSLDMQLPDGLVVVYASAAGAAKASVVGNALHWFLGDVASNATGSVTVTVQSDAALTAGTALDAQARVTTQTPDRNLANNEAHSIGQVGVVWELPGYKQGQIENGLSTLTPGALVTYILTTTNSGPSIAASALITDYFPSDYLILVGSEPAVTYASADSKTLVWDLGELAPGAEAEVRVSARVRSNLRLPDGTRIVNRMQSSSLVGQLQDSSAGSGVPCDPPSCVALPFARLDLAVSHNDSLATTTPGQRISYRIVAHNLSTLDATGVTLIEQLPQGTRIVSETTSGWSATGESGGYRFDLGRLGAGEVRTVPIVIEVQLPLTNTTQLTTTVFISDDGRHGPDANPSDNTDTDLNGLQAACVGDFVWLDTNADGLQDASEHGLSGAQLELLGERDSVLAVTRSDNSGAYRFCGLSIGAEYRVRVAASSFAGGGAAERMSITRRYADGVGRMSARDSDASPSTRTTGAIRLDGTAGDLTLDIGVIIAAETTDLSPENPPDTPAATSGRHKLLLPFIVRK